MLGAQLFFLLYQFLNLNDLTFEYFCLFWNFWIVIVNIIFIFNVDIDIVFLIIAIFGTSTILLLLDIAVTHHELLIIEAPALVILRNAVLILQFVLFSIV